MRRVIAFTAVAIVLIASPTGAAVVSRDEATELAHDAAFDDDARQRLLDVDEIDGRPVDMERLLAGAQGNEFEQRVEALLESGQESGAADPDPLADRTEAREILRQDRYRPNDIPRPFRGPLEWIAERMEPVANAIRSFFRAIGNFLATVAAGTPGGAATLWLLLGLAVVALVAWQTRRAVRRRSAAHAADLEAGPAARADDPRTLEREAAAARARGEHELAVRLLFRAGVVRLARAQVIPPRQSLTTGQIRRLLAIPEFDRVGLTFDEIAYGRRAATDDDSSAARAGWSAILQRVSA